MDVTPDEVPMNNATTCGQGLAEHAALPAGMGQLVLALAEMLDLHTKTLDVTDAAARMELSAYRELGERFGKIAVALQGVAREMERQRDLPMAAHDRDKLADPALAGALEQFVNREQELLQLLQHNLERHRQMLDQMASTRGTS
jgi:hypothetical protein